MTPEQLRDLMDFGVEVAWRAGRATLAHYQAGMAAETKPDRSPVTEADRAAEHVARRLLSLRFPGDAILGEEEGESGPAGGRRWIIDPIDGTRTFVRGVPFYGVLIALEVDGRSVLGVMHFPALDETVCAASGLGCWWNGRRARVSETDRLDRALVLTTDVNIGDPARRAGWDRLRGAADTARTWGDCYGYALVATGRAEVMLDPVLSIWDAAALVPIIEEAGGVCTSWEGRAGHGNDSMVATNSRLAGEVRRMLAEAAP